MTHRAPTSLPAGSAPQVQHPRPHPHAHPNPRAFTLLELLVVLALTALLIALLLPTLAAGRDYARVMKCLSNNRQIATAWTMYLNDSKEDFPRWTQNMSWFYGGRHPAIRPSGQLRYRPLNPYVNRSLVGDSGSAVFQCPNDRDIRSTNPAIKSSPTSGHTTFEYNGNSYFLSTELVPKPLNEESEFNFRSVNLTDVTQPISQVLLVGDAQWQYSVGGHHWDARFHNQGDTVPVAFLDGHATYLEIEPGQRVTDSYSIPFTLPNPNVRPAEDS
ncbi:MAG: prepilin-type N-terminal cleavage/methylation domain-containing protein [Planctomycetota bacterium]